MGNPPRRYSANCGALKMPSIRADANEQGISGMIMDVKSQAVLNQESIGLPCIKRPTNQPALQPCRIQTSAFTNGINAILGRSQRPKAREGGRNGPPPALQAIRGCVK
jgi:hypothetical protein